MADERCAVCGGEANRFVTITASDGEPVVIQFCVADQLWYMYQLGGILGQAIRERSSSSRAAAPAGSMFSLRPNGRRARARVLEGK